MTEKNITQRIRPKKYELKQIHAPDPCPTVPDALPIRETVFEKCKRAAQLVFSEVGPYEYLGLLYGQNGIVEAVYLPRNQKDSEASTRLEEFDSAELPESLQNYQRLGWVHSHASYGADFLSPTDESNIRRLMATSHNFFDPETRTMKYVYSIVVNRKGESNAYIDARLHCGAAFRKSVTLHLLEGGERYDDETLKSEIREKIQATPWQEPSSEPKEASILQYQPKGIWEGNVIDLLHKGYSLTDAVRTMGFPRATRKKGGPSP